MAIADYDNGLLVLRRAPAPPAQFYTVGPCRLGDTRAGGQPLVANTDRVFAAIGKRDVPTDARAVSVNVTAGSPGDAGHLRLRSWGPPPATSTVNFAAGRCNTWVSSTAAVHLVIDVNGYFR